MTITEFLLARIAEDEADAMTAVDDGPHWLFDVRDDGCLTQSNDPGFAVASGLRVRASLRKGPHIARWDPARVLAECEAKRRIVELHGNRYGLGECASCAEGWMDLTGGEGSHEPLLYPCPTLRALASAYADHPDFREEWRV